MRSDTIQVVPYNKNWPELAAREINVIRDVLQHTLGGRTIEIHHIGSTAVPGLRAKPVIDILVGVESLTDARLAVGPLEKSGYSFWRDNPNQWHFFFVKGLPLLGGAGRTHHIHLVDLHHKFFREKILFRDYLRSKPDAARDYENLKDQLSVTFSDDREGYTEGKTEFIQSILKLAQQEPSERHLSSVETLWKLNKKPVFHRYLANYVYFSSGAEGDLVVRLTPVAHRSKNEVVAEVTFMDYLASKGFPLAIPVTSVNGKIIEEIKEDGTQFVATVFKKIEGVRATDQESLEPGFLSNWGAHLGQLHLHSLEYKMQARSECRRPEWNFDSVNVKAQGFANSTPGSASDRLRQCTEWLSRLEREDDSYGLIHGDLHRGNFFVVNGQIISFDYDDSCFHWYLYDLAASLSTVLKLANSEDDRRRIISIFFEGYESVRPVSTNWKNRFEAFFQYRLALVFCWMNAMIAEGRFSIATIENWKSVEPWYLENMRRPASFY